MDHSCYVTLFNFSAQAFAITPGPDASGTYSPATIPQLNPSSQGTPGQVFFTLGSGVEGSSGQITLETGTDSYHIDFGCPLEGENFASIAGTGPMGLAFYGSVEAIQWLTTGYNWPPPNTISTSGEPLFLLITITPTQGA